MILICKKCGSAITKNIEPLPDGFKIENKDKMPLFDEGFYSRVKRFHISDLDKVGPVKGDFLININDFESKNYHHDSSRLNGCCGLDGCDGPNLLCVNGHEVATEISDCWTPLYGVVHCRFTNIKDA